MRIDRGFVDLQILKLHRYTDRRFGYFIKKDGGRCYYDLIESVSRQNKSLESGLTAREAYLFLSGMLESINKRIE